MKLLLNVSVFAIAFALLACSDPNRFPAIDAAETDAARDAAATIDAAPDRQDMAVVDTATDAPSDLDVIAVDVRETGSDVVIDEGGARLVLSDGAQHAAQR